jgi:hypothetical protein
MTHLEKSTSFWTAGEYNTSERSRLRTTLLETQESADASG